MTKWFVCNFQQSLEFPAGIGFHFPTARLIIADTFNNALQCVDTRSCVSSTFYRTEHYFSEPFGVAVSDESIFIADKNNFEIKRIDLKSGSLNRVKNNDSIFKYIFNVFSFYFEDSIRFQSSFRSGSHFQFETNIPQDRTSGASSTRSEQYKYLDDRGSRFAFDFFFRLKMTLDIALELDRTLTFFVYFLSLVDGFKISDGQMTRRGSDPILLDYIPRDKEIGHLKYELVLCNDENLTTISGTVSPSKETENSIDFLIKLT